MGRALKRRTRLTDEYLRRAWVPERLRGNEKRSCLERAAGTFARAGRTASEPARREGQLTL